MKLIRPRTIVLWHIACGILLVATLFVLRDGELPDPHPGDADNFLPLSMALRNALVASFAVVRIYALVALGVIWLAGPPLARLTGKALRRWAASAASIC